MTIDKLRPLLFLALLTFLFATAPVSMAAGAPCPPPNPDPYINTLANDLDTLSAHAEEWGTMHLSPPLLVEPSTNFNFNLQRGTSNYFSEAKSEVQASTVAFQQASQSLALSLQAQNMPGLSNSITSINSSNLPNASNVMTQAQNSNATSVFSNAQFAGVLGLLSALNGPSPTLNNSTALNIAAGDQTTEAIFRLLGDPERAAQYEGKKILFGAVTVSIEPGYRTRRDYIADLGVLLSVQRTPARLEVVRRWLISTNLTDIVRASILNSYKWTSDDDLIMQIPWSGRADPFKDLKATIAAATSAKAKLDATNALVTTLQQKADTAQLIYNAQQVLAANAAVHLKEAETAFANAPNATAKKTADDQLKKAQASSAEADKQTAAAKTQLDQSNTDLCNAKLAQVVVQTDYKNCQRDYSAARGNLSNVHITDEAGPVLDALQGGGNLPNVPLAMAVSPLSSLDVVNEGSSQRNQDAFALSLAGLLQKAGLQAQATAFEQYAKRIEHDSQTRTALPAITAYGDGGLFGWQVGPRFRAMDDPVYHNVPANVLDRQTFPALIIVGFDSDVLYPTLQIINQNVTVLEPNLDFRTVQRWIRTKHHWWGRLWQKRFSEKELVTSAGNLAHNAKSSLDVLSQQPAFQSTGELIHNRFKALEYDVYGGYAGELLDVTQVVPLPAPASPSAPSIAAVFPTSIQLEPDASGNPTPTNMTFNMVGQNLKNVTLVTNVIGGINGISTLKSANDNIITFTGAVYTNGPLIFQVSAQLTNSAGAAYTTNVLATSVVNVVFHNQPNAPQAIVNTIQSVSNGTNTLTEFTVKIAPNYNKDALSSALDVILNEINKHKFQGNNANVSVQVEAQQKKQ